MNPGPLPERGWSDGTWLRARAFREWLLVTLLACGLVAALAVSGATRSSDRLLYDRLAQVQASIPSDRVILVAIDDASLKAVGAWPWSRAAHARLLDRLTAAAPAAVGYDVMFLEPAPGDDALATALGASGRAVLPVSVAAPGDDGRAVRVLPPLAPLARVAAALGHVELTPDPDGVVRRSSAAVAVGGTCWPHLTRRLLALAGETGGAVDCPGLAAASRRVDGLFSLPPVLIPFAGPPGVFRTVSAADVLAGDVPPEFLRDRFVLVGATALGLGDRHVTATSGARGAMSGVEVQANLLDAALRHRVRGEASQAWELLGSLLPTLILSLLLLLLKPATNLPIGAGLTLVVLAISAGLFLFASTWAPPLPALFGLLAIYPLWSWRRLVLASQALTEEIARLPQPAVAPPEINDPLGRQLASLSRAAELLRDLSRRTEANARQREEVLQLLTHDLRAPLASIVALTAAPPAARGEKPFDRIGGYARRGLDLAEDYVQLARAETMTLRCETLDLSELVLEAVDELWPQTAAKGVAVETLAPDAPCLIDADRSLVIRALVNLLGNALKFSPQGGVILAAVTAKGDMAVCTVEDEGSGLPAGSADMLFEAFQLGRDPQNGRTGAGLGLAMVQRVVTRHRGAVKGENRLPAGARFTLELPLSTTRDVPDQALPEDGDPAQKS